MSHSKRGAQAIAIGMICVLLGVISFEIDSGVAEQEANEKAATSWEKAERSPLIPYPETVTYTLAKMTASGNSGMPDGDTYEDNAYTRYLKKTLNVQNEDVLEVSGDENYYLYIQRMIAENNLPEEPGSVCGWHFRIFRLMYSCNSGCMIMILTCIMM